jgi:hypothetical protein
MTILDYKLEVFKALDETLDELQPYNKNGSLSSSFSSILWLMVAVMDSNRKS